MKDSLNKDGVELGKVNPAYENDFDRNDLPKYTPTNGISTIGGALEKNGNVEVTETEEAPQREQWSNGLEFLMSCIAMSVGLGNIWRFPYTAFSNGGGAFLIPYIIVLLVIGKPLYYLEMAIGQFVSGGPVKIWHLSPALKGLGYGQMFATVLVLTYYCSIMALTVFYFVMSFSSELPWSTCDASWEDCYDSKKSENGSVGNYTGMKSSTELYLYKYVLKETDSIDNGIGVPDWRLALCLLVSWITIFLVIARGVKSSGKAAYFLAIFPYVVMITLLIRGATLPGAVDGILYFVEPKWEELLNPSVWYNAVTQAFFSLNICFGTLIMYSSYNDFHHNIHRDALIVTTLDTFTSLLAGCTIFAILGNLMHETGIKDIKHVVQGGVGLAFVSYPDAIAKFDVVPQFFSVVFFLMLYTLGIGSAVALAGAVITIIRDQFPDLKYWYVSVGTCVGGFLVGLIYITPGGQYMLTLVDFYGANFTVFILGTIEMVGIAWVYGFNNFCNDLQFMEGGKVGPYWRICWGFVTPVLMIVILIYSMAIMEPEKYHGKLFPDSAYAAGWVLFSFGVLQFPIWAGVIFFRNRHEGSLFQVFKKSLQASEKWRPLNSKSSTEWREYKDNKKISQDMNESLCKMIMRKFFGRS